MPRGIRGPFRLRNQFGGQIQATCQFERSCGTAGTRRPTKLRPLVGRAFPPLPLGYGGTSPGVPQQMPRGIRGSFRLRNQFGGQIQATCQFERSCGTAGTRRPTKMPALTRRSASASRRRRDTHQHAELDHYEFWYVRSLCPAGTASPSYVEAPGAPGEDKSQLGTSSTRVDFEAVATSFKWERSVKPPRTTK
jgi:hypothetical protein